MSEEIDLSKDAEIDKALKEFEEKSKIEEAKKTPKVLENSDVPKMTQLVMKWTGVKEQKQAEYVLLGFVIIAITISIFLFIKSVGSKARFEAPPGYEIVYPEDNLPYLKPKL